MGYNIGLNVVEVDGAGAPAIVGAAVSIGGFNIVTKRGIPNKPVRITSFTKFVEQFGGYVTTGMGAYMVKGFFDNGGQTAYINRVVDTDPTTGASPASLVLQDATPSNTLTIEAGFRDHEDPGSWGNALFVKTQSASSASSRILETAPATAQGTPLSATTDMSSFPSLSVKVDGESTVTEITFEASDFSNATTASREEIRDAVNKRTRKLLATLSNDDRLVLTSTREVALITKAWSSLQVTAANSALGFSAMGSPVLGTAAAIEASGTKLAKVDDFQVGDAIFISDGTNSAHVKLLSINGNTNTVTWTPDISTPNNYTASETTISKVEFDLIIAYGGGEDENIVESWLNLSMEPDVPNYAPTVINDTIHGSRYIVVNDENSASIPGLDVPVVISFTQFSPGQDGTPTASNFVGDGAQKTGFYAFDPVDFQLLCCERADPSIVSAALGYCSQRGDCMYIGSVPEGYVAAGQAVAYGQALQGKKVYGALYGPWIKVLDPLSVSATPFKYIPPTGHVMGVYARIESTRGIWKAPAGDEANIIGALDVETRLSGTDHTNLVKNGSVNGIRAIPGAGIIIDASRTLSTDTRWLYANVRLLFNYVKSSLKDGLRWVRQEPNRDTLWDIIKYNSVNPFLMGLWRQGAFGTGSPSEVFTVICDQTNNPPDEVDKGNLKIEVYFYPNKPAETIVIIVGQQPSGGSAAEA